MATFSPGIAERIASAGPWFYEFDLGAYGRTTSILPPEVLPIHQSRWEMVDRAVTDYFGDRLSQIRCLDVGCHEGFYSVAMANKGVREVHGLDVREPSVDKGRLVAEALGLPNVKFDLGNCEFMDPATYGTYELCLFLGVLYHLENPMLALRNLYRVTGELCLVETQVTDEVEGYTEWGARAWTKPYQGILAVIDESGEFYNDIREAGATPLVMCPSPVALTTMLRHAGFRRTEILPPPAGAYEQLARGKRVVCAAWK